MSSVHGGSAVSVIGLASMGGSTAAESQAHADTPARRPTDASSLQAWGAVDALTEAGEHDSTTEGPEHHQQQQQQHEQAAQAQQQHASALPSVVESDAGAEALSAPVEPLPSEHEAHSVSAAGVPRGFRCAVCEFDFLGELPPGHCVSCCVAEDAETLSGGGWLCRSCFSAHLRAKFPNHAATPAEQWFSSERGAVLAAVGARGPPPATCSLHRSAPNAALSLYCTAHAELVCAECVSQQHSGPGHAFVAASQAAATCR